jgi:iron complex outermembrane receptor protein
VQTGEVRVRGVELEGVASLARGLSLIAAYTWLDAEITRDNTPGVAGNRPSGVPEHMASLWLDYTFPEDAHPFAGLGIGGGVRHIGRTPAGNANLFSVPAVTLVDAALRYDLAHLSRSLEGLHLALNVNNLFDEEYVGRCDSATACFYGYRRSVFGSVVYRW